MLILSRKRGESIKIGDDVVVTILPPNPKYPDSNHIRIGIQAPEDVQIVRTEIEGKEPKKPIKHLIEVKKKNRKKEIFFVENKRNPYYNHDIKI